VTAFMLTRKMWTPNALALSLSKGGSRFASVKPGFDKLSPSGGVWHG
jgi:hypothetical protein